MAEILIADDHDMVRELMAAYLASDNVHNVTVCSSIDDALGKLGADVSYDLAIFDYDMPGVNGLEGLKRAMSMYPNTKFVLMSGQATKSVAREAMASGAMGFFPKSLSAATLRNAVSFVIAGEQYYPFGFDSEEEAETAEYMGLSKRELDALRGICEGKSNKEIAIDLHLQEVTVKQHVKNVLRKMEVSNRTQAALRARQDGFF